MLKDTEGIAYFWIGEVQLSNLACAVGVNRLVKEYSKNKLSTLFRINLNNLISKSGLKNQNIINQLYKNICIYVTPNNGL